MNEESEGGIMPNNLMDLESWQNGHNQMLTLCFLLMTLF